MKKDQPSLYAQLKNLPWRAIPASDKQHGREERRTLQAVTVAACCHHARDATRTLATPASPGMTETGHYATTPGAQRVAARPSPGGGANAGHSHR